MNHTLSVGVFCGSRAGTLPEYAQTAREVGTLLADSGFHLVFGGGNSGLMGEVSQAALSAGASVTGIIPTFLSHIEKPKDNLTEIIYVESMDERKQLMFAKSDFFLILPGGVGTLDEAFEVVTNNYLGLFRKPLGFLNVANFYDTLQAFLLNGQKTGFVSREIDELCFFDRSASTLLEKLKHACRSAA